MTTPFTISFQQTEEDLITFWMYQNVYRKEARWRRIRFYFIISIVVAVIIFTSERTTFSKLISLAIPMSVFIAWYFLAIEIIRMNYRRLARKPGNEKLFGSLELQFEADSIKAKSEDVSSELLYSTLFKIEENATHGFLYISGISAIVIPKTIFKTEDEFNAFKTFIHEKMEEGRRTKTTF